MKQFTEQQIKSDLDLIKSIHGDKYTYEHRKGDRPDLRLLEDNQKVCASELEGYHIVMTEVKNQLIDTLTDVYWSQLAEEGITKEDLELVDLDINFSPVIPYRNSKSPMGVVELRGGNYAVPGTPFANVTPDQLKVMRYRYLINR